MPHNQQSSLLNEQEMQLLVSAEKAQHETVFPLYSVCKPHKFVDIDCNSVSNLEVIILQLSASPLGSGVILSDTIEASPYCASLLQLLMERPDIKIFWLGELPSMDIELSIFDYCPDEKQLEVQVTRWENENLALFKSWLTTYRVGLITEADSNKTPQLVKNLKIFNAQQSTSDIKNLQLLVVDLNTTNLLLIDILNNLVSAGESPFLLFYGDIQANLSHAIYSVASNLGFTILASLDKTPTTEQSHHILITLFSKIYLKHWLNDQVDNLSEQGIFNLNNEIESVFCPYGMSKPQIANIDCPATTRKIISIQSVSDWYPDGLKRNEANELVKELCCQQSKIDLFIKQPQKILNTSHIFALLVMARLEKSRVYWFVEAEIDFSIDVLMFLPISDVILSKALANQLLDQPSDDLLDFIEEAKQQNIRLGAVMENNSVSFSALSLYGVEFLVKHRSDAH